MTRSRCSPILPGVRPRVMLGILLAAALSQLLMQAPGVALDSFGQIHVRGGFLCFNRSVGGEESMVADIFRCFVRITSQVMSGESGRLF